MASQSLPEKNEAEESQQASELEAKQADKSPVAQSADGAKVSTESAGEKLGDDPRDEPSKKEASTETKPAAGVLKIFDDLLDEPSDASSLDPRDELLSVTNFDELSLEAQDSLEYGQITREEKVLDEDNILELSLVSSAAAAQTDEFSSAPKAEQQAPASPFAAEPTAGPKIRSASEIRKSVQAKAEDDLTETLSESAADATEGKIENIETEEKSEEHPVNGNPVVNADPLDKEGEQQAIDGISIDPSSSNLQDELLKENATVPEPEEAAPSLVEASSEEQSVGVEAEESPQSSCILLEAKSAEEPFDARPEEPADALIVEAKSQEQSVEIKSEEAPQSSIFLETQTAEEPIDARAEEPATTNLIEAKSQEQQSVEIKSEEIKSEENPQSSIFLEAKTSEEPIDSRTEEPADAILPEAMSLKQSVELKSEEAPKNSIILEAKPKEQAIDFNAVEPSESSSILAETRSDTEKSDSEEGDAKPELSFEPSLVAASASILLAAEQMDAKPEEAALSSDPLDFGQVMARVNSEERSASDEAPSASTGEENPFEYLKEPEAVSAQEKIDAYVNNSSTAQAPAGSTLTQEEIDMLDNLHLYDRETASRLALEEEARQAATNQSSDSSRTSAALSPEEMVSLARLNLKITTGQYEALAQLEALAQPNASLSEAIKDGIKSTEEAAELAETVRKISQDRNSMTTEQDRVLALRQYSHAKKTLLVGALAACIFGMAMIPQMLHPSQGTNATQYQQPTAEKKPAEKTTAESKPVTATQTPEPTPAPSGQSGQSGNDNYSPGNPNNPTGSPNPNGKIVYLQGTSKRIQQDKEKLREARARLEFEIHSAEGLSIDATKYKQLLRSLDTDPNALSHADQQVQQIQVMAEELSRNLSARKFQLSPNSMMTQQVTFVGDKAIVGSIKPSYGVQKVSLKMAINEARAQGMDTKKYSQELQKIDQDINYRTHSDELALKMRAMEADLQGKLNGAERVKEARDKERLKLDDYTKIPKHPLNTQSTSTPPINTQPTGTPPISTPPSTTQPSGTQPNSNPATPKTP